MLDNRERGRLKRSDRAIWVLFGASIGIITATGIYTIVAFMLKAVN